MERVLLVKPASGLCNLKCDYCFYRDEIAHRSFGDCGIMTAKTQELMVKRAFEQSVDRVTFVFQGGEPTLAGLDYFKRHGELCKKYGGRTKIFNSLQTNGLLLDEEWVAFLTENRYLVGLSMDGNKTTHDMHRTNKDGSGSFNKVMRAAALMKRYGVEFNILCVVTKTVARHTDAVLNFFLKNDYRYLQFIPCLSPFAEGEEGASADDYAKFLISCFDKYYREFREGKFLSIRTFDDYISILAGRGTASCGMNGACGAYFTVEADGSVFPCDFYVLDGYRGGNLDSDSLENIGKSEAFRKFMRESFPRPVECKDCKWFALCKGGCRRHREPFTGGRPSSNRFCSAYRTFFEIAYPRMAEMAFAVKNRL